MSIVEIAKVAGVSKATVSRVLNDSPRVSPDAVDAVRRAVEKVGYQRPKFRVGRPRRTAAGIQKGSITFVFPDTDPAAIRTVLSGRLLHGVEEVMRQNRVGLQLSGLPEVDRLPMSIEKRLVDGVLTRGLTGNPQHNAALIQGMGRLPCVHLFEPKSGVTLPPLWDVVFEDNDAVAAIAFNYLYSRGRRKLAVINSAGDHPSMRHRVRAFKQLAEDAGLRPTVVSGPYSVSVANDQRYERMATEALNADRFDGLFVPGSDLDVVEIYRSCLTLGHRPVDDFSYISCNNDPSRLAALDPRLANIDIQPEAIGRAAAKMLLERLKTPSEPQHRLTIAPVLFDLASASLASTALSPAR